MAGITTSQVVTEAKPRSPWRVDLLLVVVVALLIGVGLMSLYSVSESLHAQYFAKQLLWLAIGVVPFAVFFFVHPLVWRRAATVIWFVNILLLLAVLIVGTKVNGARRWVEVAGIQFQPSEMAKIFTVLTLAAFFSARAEAIHKLSTFGLSFLHVLPTVFLINKQPHTGAALVVIIIWLSVSTGAGVPLKFVFGSLAGTATIMALLVVFGLIPKYQLDRWMGLLSGDAQGNRYQTAQAELAFGVGGIQGTGFRNGEVKRGGFIPEQHNDFIFTVIGEEGGLIGCAMVLGGFGLFFFRAWLIMFRASEPYYKMCAVGIMGLLAFHAVVNMGMNLQLMPVVGLWLPFMSYGGTALWLCLSCVGLLLNIKRHERPVLF